jgi:hypothetical protein
MKKVLLLILIGAVITFNTACSKLNSQQDNSTSPNQTENVNQTETVVSKDTSEEKAEVEPETKPEDKQETKPEVKPTTKPEVKPATKPITKPITKPEVKPSPKPETKPETKPSDNILNSELKSIIEKIYTTSEVQLPKTACTEVTKDNSKYYLGTDNIEFSEALASEPLMGSFAHSLVLLRVENTSDIEKIKAEIKNNVDPRKWICVGVEQENVVVDNIDNLIILIMNNESEKLHKAFLSLAE